MRILGTALLTVVGGLLIGSVLTSLTSPSMKFLGRSETTQAGHIDFWTGEITPMIMTQYSLESTPKVEHVWVVPKNWKDLRVIPLPVGFVVGSLLTLTVIILASRRPGKAQPDSAVPAV
jgi:hypothetical protein